MSIYTPRMMVTKPSTTSKPIQSGMRLPFRHLLKLRQESPVLLFFLACYASDNETRRWNVTTPGHMLPSRWPGLALLGNICPLPGQLIHAIIDEQRKENSTHGIRDNTSSNATNSDRQLVPSAMADTA